MLMYNKLVQLPAAENHSFQDLIDTVALMTLTNSAESGDGFLATQAPSVGSTCIHITLLIRLLDVAPQTPYCQPLSR